MRALLLSRERLNRIQRILARADVQPVTVREFARRFSVWEWELEQAAELGWIEIEIRKPRTGRPSRVVKSAPVNKSGAAKLPPYRRHLPQELSNRHWLFVRRYWCKGGISGFPGPAGHGSAFHAYRSIYCQPGAEKPTKRASAKTSAARLARRPYIRAAWLFDVRLMRFSGTQGEGVDFPRDMRSAGSDWLRLLRWLDRTFDCTWPREIREAIASARSIDNARRALRALPCVAATGIRFLEWV